MAKIHPNTSINNASTRICSSSERETFTVWMKSLVFNGNGCTVYNCRGEVVFRVDNYQKRCSRKVFLMDCSGKTLFSIYRKRLRLFSYWEGFKYSSKVNKEKPWFQVRRNISIFRKDMSCNVILKCDQNSGSNYRIVGLEAGKSPLKIIDCSGHILAEVAIQKQSSKAGVPLGEDVLTLMVEPHAANDQPLIMALVTVYGLINNKL